MQMSVQALWCGEDIGVNILFRVSRLDLNFSKTRLLVDVLCGSVFDGDGV